MLMDIVRLPTDLKGIFMDKSMAEDTVSSWDDVLQKSLLAQACLVKDDVTITAIAADYYAIELTCDELAGTIVARKEKGEWIQSTDPEHGPIRLVCPQTPANGWVFHLTEIQVNK
jgi:hypothetical protein